MICNYKMLSLGAVLAVIFITFPAADAIKCFQCNSVNNSACGNEINIYHSRGILIPTECTEQYPNEPFCRKQLIKVMDKVKNIDARVVRSCGWVKYKNPCYTADNEGHSEKVCQCFEDGCNAATSSAIFSPILLTVTAAIFLLKNM